MSRPTTAEDQRYPPGKKVDSFLPGMDRGYFCTGKDHRLFMPG
jgi:hypothetical protein